MFVWWGLLAAGESITPGLTCRTFLYTQNH